MPAHTLQSQKITALLPVTRSFNSIVKEKKKTKKKQ